MRQFNNLPRLSTKPKFRYLRQLLLTLVLVLVLGAGYVLGTTATNARQQLDLNQFWQVYDIVNRRFVGSLDQSKASEGAVAGLVQSLGDPYSMYLPAQARKDLDAELKGEFEGIGAELTQKDGLITVVAPLDSSPAAKAGLMPQDIVLKIGDESTEGMTIDQAVSKIRGPKGTTVTLEVARLKVSEPVTLTITRDAIHIDSVESKILDGKIGYMEIRQFGDDTVDLAQKAVAELAKSQPKAIIIDLRNNPGGYLDDVAPIAGHFIAPNVVVKERYKDGRTDLLRSTEVPVLPNTPLYILVNGGSASAAEILAGALQDYKRATLVGQKTFGKGSVQDIIPLKAGAALRLTIAEWLTPNDRQISKKGIDPDVVVEGNKTADSDPVLAKALEIINK